MPTYNQGWRTSQKKYQPQKRSKRSKIRIWALQGGLVLALSTVLWRVYDVQRVYGKQLENKATAAIDVHHTVLAARGSILDAQGDPLAYDVSAFNLDVKTSDLTQNASAIAGVIAPILGASTQDVIQFLTANVPWHRWPHTILETQKSQLQAAIKTHAWAPGSPGPKANTLWSDDFTFSPTEQRYYPFDDFAANTLGFMSTTGTANGGIEQEYNQLLSGMNGAMTYQQDSEGFPLPGTVQVTKAAQPGDSVQLTLDETIQGYVESVMDGLVKQYSPQHAAIIVANPQTGAILGMASRPTFDPNTYYDASSNALSQNWAVSSSFEPGSTFKPIVFASALAANAISPYQTFLSGQTSVSGVTIHDWNYSGWGTLTYEGALEDSSNVGFTKIATALGWPNLIHYMNEFGFLNKTGIDLPDEATSLIFSPSMRGPVQLATSGFGQGISVTPLQQVAAMGAIANGGKLMKPYVTSKIIGADGKVVKNIQPTVVRQGFLPQSVVDEVNKTMVLDVTKGIDSTAAIKGYDVAGKTGTANIVDPSTGQYYQDRFETSFIGYAPANDPKVEVYVTLYWPKTPPDKQWGSTVAIPPGRELLQDCLQYYHIPPKGDVQSASQDAPAAGQSTSYLETPNIIGLTQAQASAKLKQLGLVSMVVGQSGTVSRQWPEAGIEVATGSKMYALLQDSVSNGQVVMPDLTGLSLRDATNLLAALNLNIAPSGTGFVTSQSISAGSKVSSQTVVSVVLKPRT